jgi:predicted membrane protein DUF2085
MRCVIGRRWRHWWPRRLLCAGAIGWAVLIPSAAVAAGQAPGAPVVGLLAALPYTVGAVICHQQAARSFALGSQQLPVCARCTGIYVGAALIAVVATFRRDDRLRRGFGGQEALRHNNHRKVAPGFSFAKTVVLAALPTVATLAYEWSTSTTPTNVVRAIAGFPLGAAVAWVILSAVDDQVN